MCHIIFFEVLDGLAELLEIFSRLQLSKALSICVLLESTDSVDKILALDELHCEIELFASRESRLEFDYMGMITRDHVEDFRLNSIQHVVFEYLLFVDCFEGDEAASFRIRRFVHTTIRWLKYIPKAPLPIFSLIRYFPTLLSISRFSL